MTEIPLWLLKILPMWEYICPRCRKTVKANTHICIHCGEHYRQPLRIPPTVLKNKKKLEEYVHTQVFPHVTEATRHYLAQFFTTLFTADFAAGNLSEFTGSFTYGSGVIAASNEQAKTDSYSAKISGLDAAGEAGVAYKSLGSQTDTYLRAYGYFPVIPDNEQTMGVELAWGTAQYYDIISVVYNPVTSKWGIAERVNSTGSWNTTYESGATGLTTSTWICIELRHYYHATSGNVTLWLNGTQKVNITGVSTNYYQTNTAWIGNGYCTNTESPAWYFYIDAVVCADTGPIGPISSGATGTASLRLLRGVGR